MLAKYSNKLKRAYINANSKMKSLEYAIGVCSLISAGFFSANHFVNKSDYEKDRSVDFKIKKKENERYIRLLDESSLRGIDNQLYMLDLIPEDQMKDWQTHQKRELKQQRALIIVNMKPIDRL